MMHSVQIIDPNTGVAHDIPYDQLPHALEGGGQFADEGQKQKAMRIQDGSYQDDESAIPETPFNQKAKPLELELTKAQGKKPETMGWKGVKEDAIDLLRNSLKGAVGFGRRYPHNVKDFWSEMFKHPIDESLHAIGQLGSSVVGGTRDLANVPHKIFDELADKGITPNWLRTGSLPEDTGLEKFLGVEPTKDSDELIRAVPAIYGGGKLLGAGAKKVGKVINRPSKEALFQRALQAEIDKAAKTHDLAKSDLKGLEDALRLKYSEIHGKDLGDLNPVGQQVDINTKQHAIEQKRPLTEIPEQEVGEIPPEPDTKAIIQQKKDALDTAKQEAESALGTLDNPRLKAGDKVKKAITDVKQSASELYDSARKHYVDRKLKVDNSQEIKEIGKDLNDLSANEGVFEGTASEREVLQSKIDSLEGETVNASDLFDLQRTLEKMAEDTRKKQYSGVSELDFKRLGSLADRLDSRAGQLAKRLESVGGKDVQKMITEANKGWTTYKNLSARNPVGKAALKGEIPMRTMVEIAKDHPGNDFLQNLVNADPELKKHVLAAYTGESNVNKLMKPSSLAKKYLEDLPEVEEHVNALKQALQGVKEGEVKASRVKKEYDDLVKSMKDAAKEQKVRQETIQESEELKKQIKFHEEAIPKLEEKIKAEQTAGRNIDKLKDELKKRKQEIADKGGRLKSIVKFIAKVKGANMVKL